MVELVYKFDEDLDSKHSGESKRCYIAIPISGKKFDLQLFDG